ncbi:MAG: ATP-binding protein [Candidatus Omnitrophica bacterium]|nr:ATP-binding protein [Candidatus Omnitrophota bacterium]
MFKRDVTRIVLDRLIEKRQFLQIINGPRQVGKTTAIRQVLEDIKVESIYAAADLPAPPSISWIEENWEKARLKLKSVPEVILVLDEVQKIDRWSEEVKRLWDEDTKNGTNIKVVILGSSALLINKGINESLAGRFELLRISHWTWKEVKKCFNWGFEDFIYFGGYPGAALLIKDELRWGNYVRDSLIETTLSKDILMLNRVEKPALLRQLFVLACEYGGQILSYTKMLGQLADAGNTTTLATYQHLFESAFLIKGLQKFSGGALRKKTSIPKWIPLNTALMTALKNISKKDFTSNRDQWGRLVETAAGAYMINESEKYNIEVFYWRDGNYEVDFVLQYGEKMVALEIKSGRKKTNISGLEKFKKKYPASKSKVVGGTGIPLEEFFEMDVLNLF